MRAIAAGWLGLMLLLTGCTAGQPGSAAPSSAHPSPHRHAVTAGPTATPTATPTIPQPPRATDDRRGRAAFGAYVLEAWIYALNTDDPSPLLRVSGPRPCDGCQELAAELAKRKRAGWHVALDGVRVLSTKASGNGRDGRAVMSIAIPQSSTLNDDGTLRSTNPAHPHATFEVDMARAGPRFRLVSFSLS